jgi:hypothetical protein
MFQISGTSNLSDRPHLAKFIEARTFSDDEDIYTYEKSREAYYQRTTDIAVVETGKALDMHRYGANHFQARYRPVQQMICPASGYYRRFPTNSTCESD